MPDVTESYFSYNITRPYPFRWFSWVVFSGGVVATVLLSVTNLAADGYVLKSVYTTNPNATLAENAHVWYEKKPWSWTNRVSASCQPQLLTTGSSFFSTNLGLTYSVSGISPVDSLDIIPATPYFNNPLHCSVSQVYVEFIRADLRQTANDMYAWGNSYAQATATCTLDTESAKVHLNLTTRLPPMLETNYGRLVNAFRQNSPELQPSMWWGAQLMSRTYRALGGKMSSLAPDDPQSDGSYGRGDIYLVRNPLQDRMSLDFLLSHWHFTDVTGFAEFDAPCEGSEYWLALGQTESECYIPSMASQVDVFAKSFYSAVLTDLGQNDTNLLVDRAALAYLQEQSGMNATATTEGYNVTALQDLRATPATLFMQYECSVPVLKGMGSVILSVLLADLVFLQAFWLLLNLGSTWWLHKQKPSWNYCSGCQKSRGEYVPLTTLSDTSGINLLSPHKSPDYSFSPATIRRKPLSQSDGDSFSISGYKTPRHASTLPESLL